MFDSMLKSLIPDLDLNQFAADIKSFISTAELLKQTCERVEIQQAKDSDTLAEILTRLTEQEQKPNG